MVAGGVKVRGNSDALKRTLRTRGFTLLELLIALSITALIGACIAIMVNSVSAGTTGDQDGRRHLVRMQALQSRLTDGIHSLQTVLAAGNGYLVYWVGDANNNGAVDLGELGMFELDATSGELRQYQTVWPGSFSQAQITSANSEYAANTSWYSAAQTAKTTGYFTYNVIAKHVTVFNVTLDNATATSAKLVSCVVTLNDNQVARSGVIAAAVRSPTMPQ